MIQMKYLDKNGSEWSIEKGDWIGSFDKGEKNLVKNHPVKFSVFLLLILTLTIILLK